MRIEVFAVANAGIVEITHYQEIGMSEDDAVDPDEAGEDAAVAANQDSPAQDGAVLVHAVPDDPRGLQGNVGLIDGHERPS